MHDRPGAIPRQLILEMMEAGYITGATVETVQPSSLDLSVTEEIYRMRGSYLPKKTETVEDIIAHGALYKHSLDRPLEVDGTYLIKLKESLALPNGVYACTSSKSSSGRINLRTRLLVDRVAKFDSVPVGYKGPLWLEVITKSFPIQLHFGDRLNQLRFFHGEARLTSFEHRMFYDKFKLLRDANGVPIPASDDTVSTGVTMTVDLAHDGLIGWRAHPSAWSVLDTAKYDHDPLDFFDPVTKPKSNEVTLRQGSFYILATKERIIVPPTLAAEMAAYDPTKGEFRSHYAGFFDPGFGWTENDTEKGWQAVLEVSTHGHDFVLRDGQPICLMVYERLITKPDRLYGQDLQSNYTAQSGPRLAKWFKQT
ncbi:MAG: 2'-deoxycytidine 5'-triphosphate deaminase [Patescibacteria group bacterium]